MPRPTPNKPDSPGPNYSGNSCSLCGGSRHLLTKSGGLDVASPCSCMRPIVAVARLAAMGWAGHRAADIRAAADAAAQGGYQRVVSSCLAAGWVTLVSPDLKKANLTQFAVCANALLEGRTVARVRVSDLLSDRFTAVAARGTDPSSLRTDMLVLVFDTQVRNRELPPILSDLASLRAAIHTRTTLVVAAQEFRHLDVVGQGMLNEISTGLRFVNKGKPRV